LRTQAAAQGLDPNQWFDNVEVVAAQDVGRETVEYVRKIYKYYATYLLVTPQNEQRQNAKAATP
jgi:membrane-bound lytic murein transglycosylase MltF